MQELDKGAMGKRIRQIRVAAGLRQWELAKLLGTTQSAVHKYEHGVVPEPRRLVELSRIGGTSLEWVLTGRHWENGSEEQIRIDPETLEMACALREISVEGRATVDEAIGIIRDAQTMLQGESGGVSGMDPATAEASLRAHAAATLQLLESAGRIQNAVLRRVADNAEKRLENSPIFVGGSKNSAAGRSRS